VTYTVDDGTSYNDTYITTKTVNATNFQCYITNSTQVNCPGDVPSQATAHFYGELSQRSGHCAQYTDITELQGPTSDPAYYCPPVPEDKQEYAYRFKEYDPKDLQGICPSFSNRTITVSSGTCFEYEEIGRTNDRDLFGDVAAWKYTYGNKTFNSNITIPKASEGRSGTTYVYRGTKHPRDTETYACGARCILMFAHKSQGPDQPSTFYECPITVSPVKNATRDEHHFPDRVARVAAASIALQGRWAGTSEKKIWTQYQFYAARYASEKLCSPSADQERKTKVASPP
jgi:hypothetical protein